MELAEPLAHQVQTGLRERMVQVDLREQTVLQEALVQTDPLELLSNGEEFGLVILVI